MRNVACSYRYGECRHAECRSAQWLARNEHTILFCLFVSDGEKSFIMLRPEKEILSVMRIHWCERCAGTESPGVNNNQENFFSYSLPILPANKLECLSLLCFFNQD
jgi:hypothetical protein